MGCFWAAFRLMAGCTAISQVEQFATNLRERKKKKEKKRKEKDRTMRLLNTFFSHLQSNLCSYWSFQSWKKKATSRYSPDKNCGLETAGNISDVNSNKDNGFRKTVTVLKTEAELQKWVISEGLHGKQKGCIRTFLLLSFPLKSPFALTAQKWVLPISLRRHM